MFVLRAELEPGIAQCLIGVRLITSFLALEPGLSLGFSLLAFIDLGVADFIGCALFEQRDLLSQLLLLIGIFGFSPLAEA